MPSRPPTEKVVEVVIAIVFLFLVCSVGWIVNFVFFPQYALFWGLGAALFLAVICLSSEQPLTVILAALTLFKCEIRRAAGIALPFAKLRWFYFQHGGKAGIDIILQNGRAGELVNAGHAQAALDICDRLMASPDRLKLPDEDLAVIYVNRGAALRKLKRSNEALEDFYTAQKLDGKNKETKLNIGAVLGDMSRYGEAKEYFTEAIHLDEKFVLALVNRAVILERMGNSSEALLDCKKALELDPQNCAALTTNAHTLRTLRQFNESLAFAERAVALHPTRGSAFESRARVLLELGKRKEALLDFTKAVSLGSDNDAAAASLYATRAMALIGEKQFEEALDNSERALKLNGTLGAAWINKAVSLKELNRIDEAIETYKKGYDLCELEDNKLHIRLNLASIYAHQGDFEKFSKDTAAIMKDSPTFVPVYNRRAWTLAMRGEFDEAYLAIQRHFELAPGDYATFGTRGFILLGLGRAQEALVDLDKALELNVNDDESRYFRGCAREITGDQDGAAQDFAKAEENNFKMSPFSTIDLRKRS